MVINYWFANGRLPPDNSPALELCSPGLCSHRSWSEGEFVFNASILNELDLTSSCVRNDLNICSACGSNCFKVFSCPVHVLRMLIEYAQLVLFARTILVGMFVGCNLFWEATAQLAQISRDFDMELEILCNV